MSVREIMSDNTLNCFKSGLINTVLIKISAYL